MKIEYGHLWIIIILCETLKLWAKSLIEYWKGRSAFFFNKDSFLFKLEKKEKLTCFICADYKGT